MFTQEDKDWYRQKLYEYGDAPRFTYQCMIEKLFKEGNEEDVWFLKLLIDEYDSRNNNNGGWINELPIKPKPIPLEV